MIDPAYLEKLGVYTDEKTGQYMRHKIRTRIEYDEDDPRAIAKGLVVALEDTLVPHPVVLPLATDPRSIEDARVRAVQQGADFYHPTWGWLNGGRKPERDHPENLGSGSVQYETRRTVVTRKRRAAAAPEDAGSADGRAPQGPAAPVSTKKGS